ncbi:Phosphotransferase enzyme family protein [Streptomyces sp. 2323.1]|uniref:phosphotransferase n=1 Tax=Streptomyces sp. 2323.1 TaxID=1938841 RepID=UPI000BC07962|nr:phosphotransferase [Streptomyces sp. 2323.1]SOE09248.1 Phosphotransferase enzyme family protein [Streptomyces sp. 2323.1]
MTPELPEHCTHAIELLPDRVIKRFRGTDREGGAREWRALTLLAAHAPGLAPEPWDCALAADAPVVVMSRLPGVPMRGRALSDVQVAALAAALRRLHAAVPAEVLRAVPPRPDHAAELVARIRRWTPQMRPHVSGQVAQAMDAGVAWLTSAHLDRPGAPEIPPVFGAGDGNLANFLWDGSTVRIVDFEDSGRSDRVFELAEITEHVASWAEHSLAISSFLAKFDLTRAELGRLRDCRRLLALVWLFLLLFDARADNRRNPVDAVERQAQRLLDLLG